MKKILFLYKAYPFAIASYFRHVIEKRPDIDVVTCGEFFGQSIPWAGGMTIPNKYRNWVDYALPPGMNKPSWKMLSAKLGKNFDFILNVDAGFHLADKPDIPYVVVATDPHVLQSPNQPWYDEVRPLADRFFNMQRYYMRDGDIHLPYACSPDHHYATSVEKEWDASLIGLHYKQRDDLVDAIRRKGYSVFYDIGMIYDEYRDINNKSRVGINWSSLYDINARTFEMMAMMQIPVINRLPFLDELGLLEDKQYLGFASIKEGVEKVEWALTHADEAMAIARSAHQIVHENHTYEKRVQQILDAL